MFDEYHGTQDNKRRVRPTNEKHTHIREYLAEKRIAVTQEDRHLKFWASKEFVLVNGRLYTQAGLDSKGIKEQRFIPQDEDVFDVTTQAHICLFHPGQDKTFHEIEWTTAGVSRREVRELLQHCRTCAKTGAQKTTAPLKPIVENTLWGRVQIDLIDKRGDPDEEMKWICHLRDCFSKYSVACPMPNKSSEKVVKVVLTWLMHRWPPKVLQSDNGTEFKGALTLLLRQHGIQVINGRPRHPQSQGMVEKGNHILKDKIAAWRSDHQSSSWVQSIPEAISSMNAQKSSVSGRLPYEIAFGQAPHGTKISYLVREQHDVLDEDPEPPVITEGLRADGGEQASLELSETERDLLVIAPELLETIRPVPSLGREIHNRLSDHNVDQTVGQAKDSEYQSGDPGNIVPGSEGQAVQSAAIIEIRSCARTIAA